jgi:hypothetical protein
MTERMGAGWTEFDIDAAAWTIAVDRIEAGREHRVPLFEPASAILGAAR